MIRSNSLFAFVSASATSSVLYGGTLLSIVPWISSRCPLRPAAWDCVASIV